MAESVDAIRGEYRRFNSAEVGLVIRMCREARGIKRAVLATDAHVSEKTIERAEAGEGVSEESTRRMAKALGMQETTFTDEQYIPTLEEAVRIQQQNEENLRHTHRAVPVVALERASDILPLFGCYAHFGDSQNVDDEHLHRFADLKQTVLDYSDLASEMTEPDRVAAAGEILKRAREFENLGYALKVGVAKDYLWRGEPWPCSVLTAFKAPKGAVRTPDEIWLPKKALLGY